MIKLIGNFNSIRKYGTDFPKRLEQGGFKVDCISNKFTNDELVTYGLINEDLYVCRKH